MPFEAPAGLHLPPARAAAQGAPFHPHPADLPVRAALGHQASPAAIVFPMMVSVKRYCSLFLKRVIK